METHVAGKGKVLLIDDDPDMLSTTQLFLQSRGFEVATAAGPEEGTRQLEHGKPDAVVLDVMMPEGTEGLHWLWKLRQHSDPAVRDVPVIVVTAIHDTLDLRLREGDADETGDYLPVQGMFDKPVDPDKLAAKIEKVLDARK